MARQARASNRMRWSTVDVNWTFSGLAKSPVGRMNWRALGACSMDVNAVPKPRGANEMNRQAQRMNWIGTESKFTSRCFWAMATLIVGPNCKVAKRVQDHDQRSAPFAAWQH